MAAAVDTETVVVSLHSFDYMSYANSLHSYGTDGLEAAVVVAGAVVVVAAADDMTVRNHHDGCDAAFDDVVNACSAGCADDLNIDVAAADGIAVVVGSLSPRIQSHDRCT